MDHENNKTQSKIYLFGLPNLQNSILVGHIQQQLNIPCIFQKGMNVDKEQKNCRGSQLVLIDAELSVREKFFDFLEDLHSLGSSIAIAFYGVAQNHKVERLISWPKVAGIFDQDIAQHQFYRGIDAMFKGEYWLPRKTLTAYLQNTRKQPRKEAAKAIDLTKREKEILSLTATGASNQEIAETLNLSMHTIKTHMYNIFRKIEVSNRIQAVNWAAAYLDDSEDEEMP